MSTAGPTACPTCGAEAAGHFCHACGSALTGRTCGSCRAPLAAGARFCPVCGSPGGAAPATVGTAWWVAAAVLVLGLAAVLGLAVRTAPTAPGGPPAAAIAALPGGAPPDISALTPRERFDRLYDRIMRATESGDDATVTGFTPMALAAYGLLDSVDSDARYHAALLRLHAGDVAGAEALADTILATTPSHLFGFLIRGMAARWQRDEAALARAEQGFRTHYAAELRAARPEYAQHQAMLDQFARTAQAAQP